MKFEKIYLIDKWTDWNLTISNSINNFYENFSYYPIILEANSHTNSQIDFLINEIPNEKEKDYKINELTNMLEQPYENQYIKISSFDTTKASVEFAEDNNLKDKQFRLIYDSDPDWDDDDLIIDSPIDELEKESVFTTILI
jgi:predicted oxidoreductase (fatty acid repression mutant protein)